MKKLMMFIAFVLLFITLVGAVEYKPVNYVSDYAEIIDAELEGKINALAEEIERNTTVEVAVLTVPSLEGRDVDGFAVEVFEKWGVGKKDVSNGLLIVVAPNEREYRIEVGYGLEAVITDAMAGRIGRGNFVENFRAGKYGEGIYSAVQDVNGIVKNEHEVVSKYSKSESIFGSAIAGKLLVLLFLCVNMAVMGYIDNKLVKKRNKIFLKSGLGLIEFLIIAWISIVLAFIFAFFFVFFLIPVTKAAKGGRGGVWFWGGGGHGGSRGFGGFGGGMSGGGGAGGRW